MEQEACPEELSLYKKILEESFLDASSKNTLLHFFESYLKIPVNKKDLLHLLTTYVKLVEKEVASPTIFPHFHYKERSLFDFYAFSLDMVRPLIDFSASSVLGEDNLVSIDAALERNENVILLANHQAEIDPQIIDLLISKKYPRVASSLVFVAGHRVISDPLAIPFSRGTNLLCIYSKKYIESPPELKAEKVQHNAKTIATLETLLDAGGVCIFVAPSGGRDRYDASGTVALAPFDPTSVEMFHLLARKAKTKTHLHLLALSTINLLPPPSTSSVELGEERLVSYGPAHLFFGPELPSDPVENPLSTSTSFADKKELRKERSDFLFASLQEMYSKISFGDCEQDLQ